MLAIASGQNGDGPAVFAEEFARCREELWALAEREDVREAVWLSNPAVYANDLGSTRRFDPSVRPSWIKRRERTLYSYLQRFAMKNDTTSFFGPLNYGVFGPPELRLSASRIRARRTFVACQRVARLAELAGTAPIPGSAVDPLTMLMESLRDRDDHWRSDVDTLASLADEFASTPWPARMRALDKAERHYAAITGETAGGGGDGRMFRDRALVYEECAGDVEHVALPNVADALVPALELFTAYAALRRDDLRARARELVASLGGPVPLARFVSAWRRRFPQPPPTPSADALAAALTELVRERTAGDVAELSAAEVRALLPDVPDAVVASPDVMIAAADLDALRRGDYQVVLGEVHHGIQPAGWMLTMTDPHTTDDWASELAAHVPPGTANVVFGRRMKVAPPEFPGPSVEISGTAAAERVIRPADLVVHVDGTLRADGEQVVLRAPSHGVPAGYAVFECFSSPIVAAPPLRLGARTPRVLIDGVVVQRRRWEVPSADVPRRPGTSFDLMSDFAALRARHDLQERAFVRSPAEPKPVYADFACVFALDLLASLARRCDVLRFEEVLPGPGELWLRRADGTYCTEVRTVMSRGERR